MHPMFVKLFIETDADDLLDAEKTRRRSARLYRRSRRAVVVTATPRRRTSKPRSWGGSA